MKKLFNIITAMLCIAIGLCFAADAAENAVFLAAQGTGDGSSADSPLGSFDDAYAKLDGEGTIVICGDFPISGKLAMPTHTETVTITSVYGNVDYRTTNEAAIRFSAAGTINLHGPTVFENINVEIDSAATSGIVIAANFNKLKFGDNFEFVYNYTSTALVTYLTGGPNNDSTVPVLGEGETIDIEIYSGEFLYFTPFSRSVKNAAHYGTANVTIGGDAAITGCYLGPITSGSTGGTTNCEITGNATISTLYLAGNGGGMNGSVTVDARENAYVKKIDRYAASLFTNGTKTINVYGDNTTLPATLETYFDTVNVIEDEPVNLDTVFLATNGTGDGTSANSPIGNLADAFEALGDDGGTLVLISDYVSDGVTNLPTHTGTVYVTSVYNGTDYRSTNDAALRHTVSSRLVLGGPTEFDNFVFEIDSGANSGVVLAANFNPLKIGYDVDIVHNYTVTTSKMYIIGGSNNDANGNGLAEGESSSIEVYSGDYMQLTAFSRGTANKAHYGTMNITLGGDVTVRETYLGAVTTGASGGTTVLELKENVALNGLYLSGNSGIMNGDVTVSVYDNASVTTIGRYDASIHSGTKTVNVYSQDAVLPTPLDTYFDVVNMQIPMDSVTITESFDIDNIVSIMADGEELATEIVSNEDGITIEYDEEYEDFTLEITVKDTGYTVYEYEVTETDGTASATFIKNGTYDGNVIYIGEKNGNGLSENSPCSSLEKAYELLIGDGGTFVVCGEVNVAPTVAPVHSEKITVTSVFGDKDYRDEGAKLAFPVSAEVTFGGETLFENVTFDINTTAVLAAAFNPLTLGDGIEVINDYANAEENGLYIIGGHNTDSNKLPEYTEDTNITVKSGHIRCIIGFSRYAGARVHTGTATINVEGNAYVRYVFGGANNDNSTSKDTVINVRDNAIIENLYTGGSAKTNYTTGEVIINIEGGDIYEFDAVGVSTSAGKVKIYYDPRTVADGIVTMAQMAQFETISTCEKANAHSFGEVFANPFGGNLTAHTCEICDYTELLGEAPEKVADRVVFVADGGFGNGLSPIYPFGSIEDAFKALGDEGGTIVVIGECTLPHNLEWKVSRTNFSFQEPVHKDEVLITSLYDGVDYRDNGAKLIFDGNMHYRLSGPTTFNNVVFDAIGDHTTNLIAARYNKLVFGDDCRMLRTIEDGYQLWVVGGYQYFRYTDFEGVEINDPLIELASPSRLRDFYYEPEDLVDFTYTSGSGKTHTVQLQADAAAAFSAMYADMAAAGLYVPYPSWPYRSGQTQYGIFSDYVKQKRVKGIDFDEAYLSVSTAASPAGTSEHQLGVAFDIYDERLEETYGKGNAHNHYHETAEWQWIVENGPKYGIIHRYLTTKKAQTGTIFEAWHFRYVGVEHAQAISETDYCLEEYVGDVLGMFGKDSSVTILSGDFYQVMGGSRGCDDITFTGTRHVTVGENANVKNLVDVDAEVGAEEEIIIGDSTGDGIVNLIDVIRVFKYTVDNSVSIGHKNSDINGDGNIDVLDALMIIKIIVNN